MAQENTNILQSEIDNLGWQTINWHASTNAFQGRMQHFNLGEAKFL